jgi:hypothetical protein
MTDKEPEKLARVRVENDDCTVKLYIDNELELDFNFPVHFSDVNDVVDSLESFAQRRVDEALERAAKFMETNDSRYGEELWMYRNRISKGIRAMKSQGATNG